MKKFPILQRLKEITTKIGNVGNTDLQTQVTTLNSKLVWTKILDAAVFAETGNVIVPSIADYRELLVIVDTRRASNNQPFGYSNSLHLPAFLYGSNSVIFAIPLAVGDFVKFLFTASALYVTELGTLPASANAYIFTIYAR